MMRNKAETYGLKSLAYKVLKRNSKRNNSETIHDKVVSSTKKSETAIQLAYYFDRYQERAGILEYDAGLLRHEAEHIAYMEMFEQYVSEHYPSIKAHVKELIAAMMKQPTLN